MTDTTIKNLYTEMVSVDYARALAVRYNAFEHARALATKVENPDIEHVRDFIFWARQLHAVQEACGIVLISNTYYWAHEWPNSYHVKKMLNAQETDLPELDDFFRPGD